MELWQFLGTLHPKLVQIPLVLLLVGLVLDGCGIVWRSSRAHWAGMVSTGIGTMGLLFAFICGIYAEIWAGRAGVSQHPIELHELMANIASWGFVILLAWRIFLAEPQRVGATFEAESTATQSGSRARGMKAYVAIGLAWYLLLATTGWLGGQLVFEYGAGTYGTAGAGSFAAGGGASGITLADLNVLAARQTDENLAYSEWMHHVFGAMSFGLAASLLAQALWPAGGWRLKWIVPVFLLAGGVFLFFMADRDLYALTDARQWRDREVLLHKSIAIIMATVGIVGLVRLKSQVARLRSQKDAGAATDAAKGSNSKLIAVMALIGGSMLFTHVHTVAPYANVAAGVYIAHVVMGLVALGIGATRLLQDFVAKESARRQLRLAFAGLMAIEAVLLITYNEGLPWYIGYGRYNRWGPDKDSHVEGESYAATVAPFGDFRAILVMNSAAGDAHVAFRDRFSDEAFEPKLDALPVLLIAHGNEETAITLAAGIRQSSGAGANDKIWTSQPSKSNFVGHAEYLKSAAFVSARLVLRISGTQRVGYFDPWVAPVLKVIPPNEAALYQCPMHDGIRSTEPGQCPICGMALEQIKPLRPADELHDAGYDFRVAKGEREVQPLETDLLLAPLKKRGDGTFEPLRDIATMHEQPIHLIVVSEDLAFFDHVHPVPSKDERQAGVFEWQYKFPREGRYLLFAEFAPMGDRTQIFRVPLRVDAKAVTLEKEDGDNHGPLTLDLAAAKLVRSIPAGKTPQDSAALDRVAAGAAPADIEAQLISQPRTMYAGLHSELLFHLADISTGKPLPITDLKPYLGSMGHCVIISEDTGLFIHCHPEELWAPRPGERGGPVVAFHALFPKAGRYRIWGQFKRPGASGEPDRLVIADFTVEVRDPWVPAKVINYLLNE